MKHIFSRILCASIVAALASSAFASSHREAPFIAGHPKVDGADFYMFRSYEAGRDAFVTLVADYVPLQDAYGGPNYFTLDPQAKYEIQIDNVGDGHEHLTFQFIFTNTYKNAALNIGGATVPVPLVNIGPFGPGVTDGDDKKNLVETYVVNVIRGDKDKGLATAATNLTSGGTVFRKPMDNIGNKSIPNYAAYAGNHVFSIGIPYCDKPGRVFVGQRRDPFAVNLGEIFDLVNLNPVGPTDAKANVLSDKNITAIELEVPTSCLTNGTDPVIGAWTTASIPTTTFSNNGTIISSNPLARGRNVTEFSQVSRLGMPLVNEVVIGLPDKDKFNESEPKDDAQFLKYVTNPTLPALLQVLFNVQAPTTFPRADLVAAFLTGVPGLNQQKLVTPSEMLRLNTSIAPIPAAQQKSFAVLAGDTAGFPNGRRPGDDVVDIELRVAMGVLLPADQAPAGQLPYTDGTPIAATDFPEAFPYLNTPIPGSPNGANGVPATAKVAAK